MATFTRAFCLTNWEFPVSKQIRELPLPRNLFAYLPRDVLIQILLYLRISDVCNVATTCKDAKTVAWSNNVWKYFFMKTVNYGVDVHHTTDRHQWRKPTITMLPPLFAKFDDGWRRLMRFYCMVFEEVGDCAIAFENAARTYQRDGMPSLQQLKTSTRTSHKTLTPVEIGIARSIPLGILEVNEAFAVDAVSIKVKVIPQIKVNHWRSLLDDNSVVKLCMAELVGVVFTNAVGEKFRRLICFKHLLYHREGALEEAIIGTCPSSVGAIDSVPMGKKHGEMSYLVTANIVVASDDLVVCPGTPFVHLTHVECIAKDPFLDPTISNHSTWTELAPSFNVTHLAEEDPTGDYGVSKLIATVAAKQARIIKFGERRPLSHHCGIEHLVNMMKDQIELILDMENVGPIQYTVLDLCYSAMMADMAILLSFRRDGIVYRRRVTLRYCIPVTVSNADPDKYDWWLVKRVRHEPPFNLMEAVLLHDKTPYPLGKSLTIVFCLTGPKLDDTRVTHLWHYCKADVASMALENHPTSTYMYQGLGVDTLC